MQLECNVLNSSMKILEVAYVSDYLISVKFADGSAGIIDLNDFVTKGIFKNLQDKEKFAKVYTTGYSVAWSNELEIDGTAIYLEITGKHFGEITNPKFTYATD